MATPAIEIGVEPAAPRMAWRLPLLVAALVLGLVGRIAYSLPAPLWFDETFTGVIAGQRTFAGLVRWCLIELTGPAYYMPMWLWVKVAGTSDLALRLPSIALSIATPLAVLRFGHRCADLRWWWGVMLLLWVPIFAVAGEARPYPVIFAFGAAQAVLFLRLLERPTTGRASAWIAASSILILCHYWSVIPGAVQGLAYLAVHRWRAVRTWPALVFLAPMLAWSAVHLPQVLAFTIGGSSGIDGLSLASVLDLPQMLLGVGFTGSAILAAVAWSAVAAWRRTGWRTEWIRQPEAVLALCGVASVAIALAIALVRPGFAPRYMMAAMPAVLFGLALWARWMVRRDPRPVMLAVGLMLATAAGLVATTLGGLAPDPRHKFQLETPSAWLAERRPDRLIVFWDGPVGEASSAFGLAEVGSFFLTRAGQNPVVSVARAGPSEDPNRQVLAQVRPGENSAILWFANDALPASRRPRVTRYTAGFECRDFGGGVVTMTACRQQR